MAWLLGLGISLRKTGWVGSWGSLLASYIYLKGEFLGIFPSLGYFGIFTFGGSLEGDFLLL